MRIGQVNTDFWGFGGGFLFYQNQKLNYSRPSTILFPDECNHANQGEAEWCRICGGKILGKVGIDARF